jgi:hypothetical protein
MIRVADLRFGEDDAESDLANGLLQSGFLPTAAYNAARSGRKTLIIGRKGSGKSAICRWLASVEDPSGSTFLITPDDAVGDEMRRFDLQGLNGETARSLVWRYVFCIQIARYLVNHARTEHRRKIGRLPRSIRRLRRFLRANRETGDRRLYDRFLTGIHGLQSSLSLEVFGIKAAVERGASEGAQATRQLDVIEAGIADAFRDLACPSEHGRCVLLVDQVEQVWSNDASSDAMVIGLLLAQKRTSSRFGPAARCVVFLRADIYDSLQFSDSDKFRGSEERIEWDPDNLRELAITRARASLSSNISEARLWSDIFPATVDGEPMPDYLLRRSLRRPRDFIQFLNRCCRGAAQRDATKIDEDDVIDATRQFSIWKLQDLANEYLANYPFLAELLVMFQNSGFVVMRGALEKRLSNIAPALHQRYPGYVHVLSLEGTIDLLYSIGFLGVRRGTGVTYADGNHASVQPHEIEFHVHPCFRSALNAEAATDLSPYAAPAPAARSASMQVHRVMLGGVHNSLGGSDHRVRASIEFQLLDSVRRSAERILGRIARAQLPSEAREELAQRVRGVLNHASEAAGRAGDVTPVNAFGHAEKVAEYLQVLGAELLDHGLAGHSEGDTLIRTIEDEARRLRRAARGDTRT